jgi:hypothetical protein
MRRAAFIMAAVLVLAGCGGGGSSAAGDIDAAVKALEGAGMTCDAPHAYENDPDASDIGTPPDQEAECKDGKVTVTVSEWKNSGQADSAMASGLMAACAFGIDGFTLVTHDAWVVSSDSEGDVSDEDLAATNKRIEKATGGELETKNCPTG